jgi:hypothetical protein
LGGRGIAPPLQQNCTINENLHKWHGFGKKSVVCYKFLYSAVAKGTFLCYNVELNKELKGGTKDDIR